MGDAVSLYKVFLVEHPSVAGAPIADSDTVQPAVQDAPCVVAWVVESRRLTPYELVLPDLPRSFLDDGGGKEVVSWRRRCWGRHSRHLQRIELVLVGSVRGHFFTPFNVNTDRMKDATWKRSSFLATVQPSPSTWF